MEGRLIINDQGLILTKTNQISLHMLSLNTTGQSIGSCFSFSKGKKDIFWIIIDRRLIIYDQSLFEQKLTKSDFTYVL